MKNNAWNIGARRARRVASNGRIPTERHVLRLHLFPGGACNDKTKQNLLLNKCSVVFELADIPNRAKNNKLTDAGNQFGNIFHQPLARQPAL
jgi:hypothetical protein